MIKRAKVLALVALMVPFSMINTSCIGSFSLTNKVYQWNKSQEKWLDELIFLVFIILPVYGISILIDGIILNSIEFWTGTNPVAMAPGDKEVEIVKGEDGNTYEIAATQNRFDISIVNDDTKEWQYAMVYNPKKKTWSFDYEDQSLALMTISDDNSYVTMHLPGDQHIDVALENTRSFANRLLDQHTALATAH